MKFSMLVGLVTLLFIPLTGCAESISSGKNNSRTDLEKKIFPDSEIKTELKDHGNILSIKRGETGTIDASYVLTYPPTREDLANRIIELMKVVEINGEFIQKMGSRLQRNRVLGKEEFSLPLTDFDGKVYRFNFISDTENGFYVISYASN
ncbi:hypothetical protein [Microbulbifer sp. ALW1]|uniref:hypothetical protein n=1 Tax=Microbulbifer sp. (strain ALW1) TaxID=1516059 RepID=UPI001359F175|nr:hypothetical protein [Microbulbifer sp. ALW1]